MRPKVDIDIERLTALRKQGYSLGQLAKEFGCSVSVIQSRLAILNLGGKSTKGGRPRKSTPETTNK